MQPRLMRSRNEVVIAGVCGGLGEYFNVDPVIVRLIFVLVTVTTGVGLLVYPVLWAVMPKAPASSPGFWPQQPGTQGRRIAGNQESMYVMQEAKERTGAPISQSRPPEPLPYGESSVPYNVDPASGLPIGQDPASTGQTVQLGDPISIDSASQQPYSYAPRPAQRKNWWGIVLVAIGVFFLAGAFDIDLDILFPIFLIGMGALLLLRRR